MFWVSGFGFEALALWLRAKGFRVLEFWVSGFGFEALGLWLGYRALGFRVLGFGFWALGFWVWGSKARKAVIDLGLSGLGTFRGLGFGEHKASRQKAVLCTRGRQNRTVD